MTDRKYLPSLPELIDRMTIVQLKAIYISDHKTEYDAEIDLILNDIDIILKEKDYRVDAKDIRAIAVLQLVNATIWRNESEARAGGNGQDTKLKFTHSINGTRCTAKNILAHAVGDRLDYKIDALAADLDPSFGAWQIWPVKK